jgi:hypothetical protein
MCTLTVKMRIFGLSVFQLFLEVMAFNLSIGMAQATPVKMAVFLKGTNQVELRFGPLAPDVDYAVLIRSNSPGGHWMRFSGYLNSSNTSGSITQNLDSVAGLTEQNLKNWTFVAGVFEDSQGDELPSLYKELILHTDPFAPGDPYADLAGDGWTLVQKLQMITDPLQRYPPAGPKTDVDFRINFKGARSGDAILTWQFSGAPAPDYFIIEKADRTFDPPTNGLPFMRPGQFNGQVPRNWMTNRSFSWFTNPPSWPTNRPYNWPTNRTYPPILKRPINSSPNLPPFARAPFDRYHGQMQKYIVTGPYQEVALIPGKAGAGEYSYVATNVDILIQPLFHVHAHYAPLNIEYDSVNTVNIRKTIIPITAEPSANGFELTALHPAPNSRYLLLVRDRNNPQWRASGYFIADTNRDPVHLQVDKKGMMPAGGNFFALPEVKFLPDVVEPEFTAGRGEDADGDGLPDIYEVLVTHTDPGNPDTGSTGILDGFKEMTGDGWSNLEKFRRRIDPLQPVRYPEPVVLTQPTLFAVMQASNLKSDLKYEPQIDVRMVGTPDFKPVQQALGMLYRLSDPRDYSFVRGNFDVRIRWIIPQPRPRPAGYFGP